MLVGEPVLLLQWAEKSMPSVVVILLRLITKDCGLLLWLHNKTVPTRVGPSYPQSLVATITYAAFPNYPHYATNVPWIRGLHTVLARKQSHDKANTACPTLELHRERPSFTYGEIVAWMGLLSFSMSRTYVCKSNSTYSRHSFVR